MIYPHNVSRLVSTYITDLLPSIDLTHARTARDEGVARSIFEDIKSIGDRTRLSSVKLYPWINLIRDFISRKACGPSNIISMVDGMDLISARCSSIEPQIES